VSRQTFVDLVRSIGSDPIAEEQAILSIAREFLPACALAVIDGAEPTEDYWAFLISQTEQAQEEHDREYQAGHEWHDGRERAEEDRFDYRKDEGLLRRR
jgi:hypothetical protein